MTAFTADMCASEIFLKMVCADFFFFRDGQIKQTKSTSNGKNVGVKIERMKKTMI